MEDKKLIIKDNLRANVEYKGCVTVEYYDKKGKLIRKTKHNTGQIALYNSITKALAGYNVDDFKPSRLMAYNGTTRLLSQPISYTTTPLLYKYEDETYTAVTDEANVIQYTFTIPAGMITSPGTAINQLKLLNNQSIDSETISVCAVVNELNIPTGRSTNIVVYWRLQFQNA